MGWRGVFVMLAGGALAVLTVGPVLAVSSSTARATNTITIYAGPGYAYAPIGKLPAGAVIRLAECTRSGRWCQIFDRGPGGWVLASYLVGSAAKLQATPFRPLVNPFTGLLPLPRHRW